MRLNKYSEVILNDEDLLDLLYSGKSNLLSQILAESSNDVSVLKDNNVAINIYNNDETLDIVDFDKKCQDKWFIPDEYQSLDIRKYCLSKCTTTAEGARVLEEYGEFEKRNMVQVLKFLKYLVDLLRKENLVWGVGRGSSVSSYILYLIGIHKIDSIKYNLDWREFIR